MWHLLHMYYYKTRNLLVQETGLKQKSKQKKPPKLSYAYFLQDLSVTIYINHFLTCHNIQQPYGFLMYLQYDFPNFIIEKKKKKTHA